MKLRDVVVLLMGLVMLILGFSARSAVPFRENAAALTASPLEDDSYYTQSYARSIARGSFFSLNGVHRGDAYFPVFTLMSAAVQAAAGGDPVRGMRWVLCLNFALSVLSAAAAGFLVYAVFRDLERPRRMVWSFFAAGAYSCNAVLFLVDMNAMESGLVLLLFLLAVLHALSMVRRVRCQDADFAVLGGLLAALCLTRIDMAVFTFLYGMSSLWTFRGHWSRRRFMLAYGPAAVMTALWILIGHAGTGSWIPTGGAAYFDSSNASFTRNILKSGAMFAHFVIGLPYVTWYVPVEWVDFPSRHRLLPAAALLLVVLAGFVLARSPEKKYLREPLRALIPAAAGLSGMLLLYLYFYSAAFFFQRYFSSVEALMVVGWSCVLCIAVGSSSSGRAIRAFGLFLWAAYVFIFSMHQQWISSVPYGSSWPAYQDAKSVLLPGQRAASFESGILGYYLPESINLDGKTNVDVIRATRGKEGELARYIAAEAPDYIVDRWGAVLQNSWAGRGPLFMDPIFLKSYEFVHACPYLWRRKA